MKLVAVLLVAVSGCAPFGASGAIADDGGADAASRSDAATTPPATDAGSNDGSTESPACVHDLCERFDTAPPWTGWIERDLSMASAGDGALFVSSPRSLKASVPLSPGGGVRRAFLERAVPVTQHVVLSASLRVRAERDTDSEVDVLALESDDATLGRVYFAIVADRNGSYVLEWLQNGDQKKQNIGQRNEAFERLTLDVDLLGLRVRAYVDGALMREEPLAPTNASGVGFAAKTGVVWTQNTKGSWLVNVDDLTLDW